MTKHTDQDKCHCDECYYKIPDETPPTEPHYHKNAQGEWVKCYHECKSILRQPSFWVLQTFLFPIEHGIWTLVYNFFGWGH